MKKWLLIIFIGLFFGLPVFAVKEKSIQLDVGESKILAIKGFSKIVNSNSDVIELVVANGQEILLNAKKVGLAEVYVWADTEQLLFKVTVKNSYASIETEIAKLINNPEVSVRVNDKFVILSGTVANDLEANRAIQYGKMYRENVLNDLTITSNYQILLSILVTELKKDSEKKYGVTWGTWWPTQSGPPVMHDWEYGVTIDKTGSSLVTGTSLGAVLNLMQRNGDAKILAQPSLLSIGGKEANFLAGGEIPIPMSDGKGGIIVEWKEYGVRLKVTPNLEKNDLVAMNVAPEVSSLDWSNAIVVNGFKLPAISSRKASTNVKIRDGGTFVIGGLLQRQDSVNVYKMPVLGDIPIIGALFRSKSFQKGDTELLLFVSPKIIRDQTTIDPNSITHPTDEGPYFNSNDQRK